MMLEKYEVCCGMMHGFNWAQVDHRHAGRAAGPDSAAAQEHVLQQEDGKQRFIQVRDRAIAGIRPLCGP